MVPGPHFPTIHCHDVRFVCRTLVEFDEPSDLQMMFANMCVHNPKNNDLRAAVVLV